MDPRNELPSPPEHLLLPKAHVHFFAQIVVLVIGILLLVGGVILLIIGFQDQTSGVMLENLSATEQAYELLFFLAAGIVLGLSVPVLLGWFLWKFAKKFRVRFFISLTVSVVGIVLGLLSIAISDPREASHYTLYFFALTAGLLSGLLSLFYFFSGFSRHIFKTHKEGGSFYA